MTEWRVAANVPADQSSILYSAPFVTRHCVGLVQDVLDRWLLPVTPARETGPVLDRLATSKVDGQP
jgi:hypothetical protein